MFQILNMLDQMKRLKLPWIPISLHHDGCALLVELDTFEENKTQLVSALKARLAPSGMQIKGLEFIRYESDVKLLEEDSKKEGRLL